MQCDPRGPMALAVEILAVSPIRERFYTPGQTLAVWGARYWPRGLINDHAFACVLGTSHCRHHSLAIFLFNFMFWLIFIFFHGFNFSDKFFIRENILTIWQLMICRFGVFLNICNFLNEPLKIMTILKKQKWNFELFFLLLYHF